MSKIIEINVGEYLRHKGFDVDDYCRIDNPFRKDSDSNSFVVSGPVWFDHRDGVGGNTWSLAMDLNGDDKRAALKDIYAARGLPFNELEGRSQFKMIERNKEVKSVLNKIKDAYPITSAPDKIKEYMRKRKVSKEVTHIFSYVPKGGLLEILDIDEIQRYSLSNLEEKIIVWYIKGGEPVYYSTRSLESKQFRKGYLGGDEPNGLENPIWGFDNLYTHPNVIWAEGIFDCASLMVEGYGVAGELTCNLIGAHEQILLKALRWREQEHPDWKFTICLDNDEPDRQGIRQGNVAAEKIAMFLIENGIDCNWLKWTKTEEESDTKIDINELHQKGGTEWKSFLDRLNHAPTISECFNFDLHEAITYYVKANSWGCTKSATKILSLALIKAEERDNVPSKRVLEQLLKTQTVDWRDVYTETVEDIVLDDKKCYVFYKPGYYNPGEETRTFSTKTNMIENLRQLQRNPDFLVKSVDMPLLSKKLTWQVVKENKKNQKNESMKNLFVPTPTLMQTPVKPSEVSIPPMWNRVLDNTCDEEEKEWLLNHMATYVQTLKKPLTIPVFVSGQGTGKTAIMTLFGAGFGQSAPVGNHELDNQFNAYLLNAVIYIDEMSENNREANKLKNKLKTFINETHTINQKFLPPFTTRVNNYVAIAYNPAKLQNPLNLDDDDRRYSILSGGKKINLRDDPDFDYDIDPEKSMKAQTNDFFLYLLSRDIDIKASKVCLENEAKQHIQKNSKGKIFYEVEDFLLNMITNPKLVAGDEYYEQIPHVTESAKGAKLNELAQFYTNKHKQSITSQQLREALQDDKFTDKYHVYQSGGYWCIKHKFGPQEGSDSDGLDLFNNLNQNTSFSIDTTEGSVSTDSFETTGDELFGED